MPRSTHPHVAIDGAGGPPGQLPGHLHASDPQDGITFQCPSPPSFHSNVPCGHIWEISWEAIEDINEPMLEREPTECLHLPPCPACGAITQFSLNDISYGSDLPEHHTMKMLHDHARKRPRLRKLTPWNASSIDAPFQGRDFSHLPAKDRPAQHQKVDLQAEINERRDQVRNHDPLHGIEHRPQLPVPGQIRSAE